MRKLELGLIIRWVNGVNLHPADILYNLDIIQSSLLKLKKLSRLLFDKVSIQ